MAQVIADMTWKNRSGRYEVKFFKNHFQKKWICQIFDSKSNKMIQELDDTKVIVETQNVNSLMRGNNQQSFQFNELSEKQCDDVVRSMPERNADYFDGKFVIHAKP